MLLLQTITTWWTKASRGMPGAEARNAVAEALVLPHATVASTGLLIHQVEAQEASSFELKHRLSAHESPQLLGQHTPFAVRWQQTSLCIYYRESPGAGAPSRYTEGMDNTLFVLEPGCRARFLINYRLNWAGAKDTHYRKLVANFAHLESFQEDVFLCAEPVRVMDMMTDIF
ncbi:MAG: hypothetical protein ACI841_004824 [Planctomycetota bacterium]|jgi:hypothetical protein